MKFYTSEPPKKISDFAKDFDFETLRPFYDTQANEVMNRIANYEKFHKAMAFLFPEISKEDLINKTTSIHSLYEFQTQFMRDAIWRIVKGTSTKLTWSGLEHLDKNKAYLYIANHRDILLDSAILQIILDKEEFETSEILFGSNLIEEGFISDFVSMNRMFSVEREGNVKELFEISRKLSAYIRHTIIDKNVSVWIAQRNGRTKDGNDLTQTGLLKMLNMSGNKDFESNFSELNIVPLSISYEYEPCDALKAQELHLSSLPVEYKKAPGEDLNSIITGIKQFKGNIHVAFGKPIQKELLDIETKSNDKEKIKALVTHIDKQIHQNYKLNAINYVAYDLLHQTTIFENNYNNLDKENFITYMNSKISELKGEQDVLKELFITQYANPVKNKLE